MILTVTTTHEPATDLGYAASSFLSVAINRVFGTALGGLEAVDRPRGR